ncbi:unnamed protein product, partial [Polarella glacialis]
MMGMASSCCGSSRKISPRAGRSSDGMSHRALVALMRTGAQCAPNSVPMLRLLCDTGVPGLMLRWDVRHESDHIQRSLHGNQPGAKDVLSIEWVLPSACEQGSESSEASGSTTSTSSTGAKSSRSYWSSWSLFAQRPLRSEFRRVVLYLHGGAYLLCTPGSLRGITYNMAASLNAAVCVPEYRRPPEHPVPLPMEDALLAYRHILETMPGAQIVLAGDSAGGGIAAAMPADRELTQKQLGEPESSLASHNPFASNGLVTRFAEYIPLLNKGVQKLHSRHGQKEALERARRKNPVGADGYLTRAAERIPGVSSVVQELHRHAGRDTAAARARDHNPLGANGFITKVGEHIPVLADGIRCLHHFKGQTEAEERARAHSLQKHLSKDGALVKLAELLPGSNLIAATVLDFQGHHEEAEHALDLLHNWRNFGSADGALARVAMMVPGVDVIAFGLHANAGNFAQAVRSISKTRWVDLKGDSVVVLLKTSSLHDFEIEGIEVAELVIRPTATFIGGGLLDLCANLLEVNQHGQRRWSVKSWAKDSIIGMANHSLHNSYQQLVEMVPSMGSLAMKNLNSVLADLCAKSLLMRMLLPQALPTSPQLLQDLQQSIPRLSARHGRLSVQAVRASPGNPSRSAKSASPAPVLCVMGLGLAWHSVSSLACLAGIASIGCAAGLGLGRTIRRLFVPWLNDQNEEAWAAGAATPAPVFIRHGPAQASSSSAASSSRAKGYAGPNGQGCRSDTTDNGENEPNAAIIELPCEDVLRLTSHFCSSFFAKMPLCRLLGERLFSSLKGMLVRCLADSVDGTSTVPFVLNMQVPEQVSLVNGTPVWLPKLHFVVVADVRLDPDGPYLACARLAVRDDVINQVLDVLSTQIASMDLRDLDHRLASFTEPVHLESEVVLSWSKRGDARLEIHNLKMHLGL